MHTIYRFQYKKRKSHLIIPNLLQRDFCLGSQERVRNIRGKQAISVRATEVLLYLIWKIANILTLIIKAKFI